MVDLAVQILRTRRGPVRSRALTTMEYVAAADAVTLCLLGVDQRDSGPGELSRGAGARPALYPEVLCA